MKINESTNETEAQIPPQQTISTNESIADDTFKHEPISTTSTNTTQSVPEGVQTNECLLDRQWKRTCPYCFKEFAKYRNLCIHRQEHIDAAGGLQCDLCPYNNRNRLLLIAHMKSKHTSDRFQCDICGKVFSVQSQVKQHKKEEHFNHRHNCQQCSLSFKRAAGLNKHVRVVHEKLKKCTCDECGKGFASAYALEVHVIQVHRKETPYPCKLCAKRFGTRSGQIAHESKLLTLQLRPFKKL